MVTVMHRAFLSLLIPSWALISSGFGIWAAKPRCPASLLGGGWAGSGCRNSPKAQRDHCAALQLQPLGWESLKQQTSQKKGMFHCSFCLSGFLFFKELFQHLWGRGLACTEPGPRADPCPGGKSLTSARGRGCKRSAVTFARDLQQECWRLGFSLFFSFIFFFFFKFIYFYFLNFVPSLCLRDDNNQHFTETKEVAKVEERVQLATLLAEGLISQDFGWG